MRTFALLGLLSACAASQAAPNHDLSASGSPAPTRAPRTDPAGQPHELGRVRWIRDLRSGRAEARATGRPLLILFTEVPGCSTVNAFADAALAHPLLVEATEDLFVPVVIYNNTRGDADAEALQAFGEPAWNNPVVRIFDPSGSEIAPRYASGWTAPGYAATLAAALARMGRPIPGYLAHVAADSANDRTSVFSMSCFWSGEVGLAGLPGVRSTRPGFLAGREVVEVTWDPGVTDLGRLARQAATAGAATGLVARTPAEVDLVAASLPRSVVDRGPVRYTDGDDKFQLRGTNWRDLNLTPSQATALNRAWVTPGEDLASILSPRQLARLER